MASTIQIKNSTTSGNAPSSLTTGELAINVVDGNFFYGSGSAVKQNFAVNTVSASGAIVASNLSGTNTGDQDLSSLATIVQLNASSSTLQTNIDTKVDTSGTPADNQISIFTDADTIEGQSRLTFDTNVLKIHRNDTAQGIALFGGQSGVAGAYLSPMGSLTSINYGSSQTGWIFNMQNNKLTFDGDSTNSYIQADTDNPENIEIHADGNIELRADDNLEIHSPISTAITASSNISASGTITGNSLVGTVGTATQGTIDHDSLANFVANEHIDHSGVSITAGAGLTGGGTIASTRDIAVGAGTGVTVNADDIAIGQDVAITANVQFANITGSAISASGTIVANKIESNALVSHLDDPNTGLQFSSDTVIIEANNVNVARFNSTEILLNLKTKTTLEVTSTTDGDANGDIVYFGGTTSMDVGQIYNLNGAGGWTKAQANSQANSDALLAVALGAASDTNGMLLKGMVTLDHDPGTIGDPLYLSDGTAGQATSTAPNSTNDIVRLIGYCVDSTNGQIYFNPSNDFIKHA